MQKDRMSLWEFPEDSTQNGDVDDALSREKYPVATRASVTLFIHG